MKCPYCHQHKGVKIVVNIVAGIACILLGIVLIVEIFVKDVH